MSDLYAGAVVVLEGEIAGWIAEICLNGAEPTMARAKRNAVTVPTEAIAKALEEMRKARIVDAEIIDTANRANARNRGAIDTANEARKSDPRPSLWGVCEVATHTGLTESRVRQLAASGELPATSVNSTWVFDSEEVRRCRP